MVSIFIGRESRLLKCATSSCPSNGLLMSTYAEHRGINFENVTISQNKYEF